MSFLVPAFLGGEVSLAYCQVFRIPLPPPGQILLESTLGHLPSFFFKKNSLPDENIIRLWFVISGTGVDLERKPRFLVTRLVLLCMPRVTENQITCPIIISAGFHTHTHPRWKRNLNRKHQASTTVVNFLDLSFTYICTTQYDSLSLFVSTLGSHAQQFESPGSSN